MGKLTQNQTCKRIFGKENFKSTIAYTTVQWETVAAEVSNAINDLPLALGNIVSDFKNMDLIIPNRLKLGRNNERSPVSPMKVVGNHPRVLEENKKIFNIWFETWLISHILKLMEQPKWFHPSQKNKPSLNREKPRFPVF